MSRDEEEARLQVLLGAERLADPDLKTGIELLNNVAKASFSQEDRESMRELLDLLKPFRNIYPEYSWLCRAVEFLVIRNYQESREPSLSWWQKLKARLR